MYEEMTFEYILELMMEDMPNGIDTSEGSLIYHACSKCAAQLEEAYLQLAAICENIYPDTADLDHLVLFGQEKGIYIEEATAAVFKGKFNIPVEIGSEFSGDDYDYIVTELIDDITHTYKLECEETGTAPNGWLGELTALDDIDGLETAELVELIEPGSEEEDEESYRMRLLDSFEIKPFAGNKAYYIQEIEKIEGVGGVKVYRREGGTIPVYVISSTHGRPDDDVIQRVQEAVDPLQNNGDGIGIAPIGHSVVINGVIEEKIDIDMVLIFDDGYAYEDLKSQIESAISEYFLLLRKEWIEKDNIVVRKAGIENAIFNIEGVQDVTEIKLNDLTANITLDENVIPVQGDVVCS